MVSSWVLVVCLLKRVKAIRKQTKGRHYLFAELVQVGTFMERCPKPPVEQDLLRSSEAFTEHERSPPLDEGAESQNPASRCLLCSHISSMCEVHCPCLGCVGGSLFHCRRRGLLRQAAPCFEGAADQCVQRMRVVKSCNIISRGFLSHHASRRMRVSSAKRHKLHNDMNGMLFCLYLSTLWRVDVFECVCDPEALVSW